MQTEQFRGIMRTTPGMRQTVSARMTTDDEKHSRWMNLYRLAYLERDSSKLVERIAEAEQAMELRQKELKLSGRTKDPEYFALANSLEDLSVLRQRDSQRKL